MLLPKRVKYRRVHRGRLKGKAMRGNFVSNGEFGLMATEPCWITSNQIEAARIAMTRFTKRSGQVWIKIFPDKPVTKKLEGLKKDLFMLRMQHATNQLDNPMQIAAVKKDIARIKTIIREKETNI